MSYVESSANTTTSSTSTGRPGDSGHTQPDPEDVATREAGLILRAGAAGAEAGASGSFRRLIYRLNYRVDNLPTDRGTTFRGTISTAPETWDTRRGGQQRGNGHHHHRRTRTRTNTGLPLARGLRRGPIRRRCRQVRLLPSSRRQTLFSTAAGHHRKKDTVAVAKTSDS